jgi:hypothetical protein
MRTKASLLLLVTGVVEVTVGIGFLLTPSVVLVVLLGIRTSSDRHAFCGAHHWDGHSRHWLGKLAHA